MKRISRNEARIQRYLTRQYLLDPRYRIWYFVPHPDQDLRDASPFQFYLPGVLNTADIFACVAAWPADIREFSAEPQDILIHRTLGHLDLRAIPIQYSAFASVVQDRKWPFSCVLSTPETCEFVTQIISPHQKFWLHISTEKTPDVLYIKDVTPDHLKDHVGNIVHDMAANDPEHAFFKIARTVLSDSVYGVRTSLSR